MFSKLVIFYLISMIIEFSSGTNNNTTKAVIPLRLSEYNRLMTLRKNYWKVRTNDELKKLNYKRIYRIDKKMQKVEIKRVRSRLENEKEKFEEKLSEIKSEINSLTRYRFLSIVKNQIAECELHAIDFSPNMTLVHQKSDLFNPRARFEELRRQKWVHLFENYMNTAEMKSIIIGISEAGIRCADFSERIARGFELLLDQLKVNRVDEVTFLEKLTDFNQTIIGDLQIDECLLILMKDYENRESLYWQD